MAVIAPFQPAPGGAGLTTMKQHDTSVTFAGDANTKVSLPFVIGSSARILYVIIEAISITGGAPGIQAVWESSGTEVQKIAYFYNGTQTRKILCYDNLNGLNNPDNINFLTFQNTAAIGGSANISIYYEELE